MDFRFYSNMLSQASKNAAAVIFVSGMMLIGFGFLIYVLRDLFAVLFAILFCAAGLGCMATAVKIFWSAGGFSKSDSPYRENVRIHYEDDELDI